MHSGLQVPSGTDEGSDDFISPVVNSAPRGTLATPWTAENSDTVLPFSRRSCVSGEH